MKRVLLLGLLAALLATGCLTRSITTPVFEQGQTQVLLRSQKKGGGTLPKGYAHPLAISAARVAHILSRIDLRRGDETDRVAAIPLDSLYVIADGVAQAFGKADANQEVVVMSVRRGRHWGIFDRSYLTSFVAWCKDDLLYVNVARSDWEIPRNLETDLPQPRIDEEVMKFRLVASEGMSLVGPQTIAAVWRDPIFKRATRTRILPGGKVVRREVLMESPEETPPAPLATDVLPANLAPDTLRQLADLEESKKRGEITQAEYGTLREKILRADPSFSE
jgi:hypothetical protein